MSTAWFFASRWLLAHGFSHVSDDDFARTVIAERFAAAPRLDPSGTSWLPAPFWLTGSAMMLFGRSIAVARATQGVLLLGCFALALRELARVGASRREATAVVLLGFASPYTLWLSAAQVPEAWCALLIATACFSLVLRTPSPAAAAGLCLASLCRYEAWPVAAVFALRYALELGREDRRQPRARLAVGLLPLLGPLAWMLWNQHAHGDALHFFARVSRYHARFATPHSALERVLDVPGALVELFSWPLLVVATLLTAIALLGRRSRRALAWPLLAGLALLVFLAIGSWREGAPTHHPERALLATLWLLAFGAVWGARDLLVWTVAHKGLAKGAMLVALPGFFGVFAVVELAERCLEYPGRGEADRGAQIAEGHALRDRQVHALSVRPCRYEHFALLAAFGAPERARIDEPPVDMAGPCPRIVVE